MPEILEAPQQRHADSNPAAPPRRCLRVLHVVDGEHYAGPERVQDLLAERLPEFGFEAAFVTLKQGAFAVHRQAKAAPCVSAAMMGRWDLTAAWRAASLIREAECALIHTHSPRSLVIGAGAAALTGKPVVHHVHRPTTFGARHAWKRKINDVAERIASRKVAAVVAASPKLLDEVHGRELQPPAQLIRSGVADLGPLAAQKSPVGEWTLGVAALFRPQKGLEVVLEAMAHLRAEGRRVRLLGVGRFETGEYAEAVRRRTGELRMGDCVEWAGFRDDLAAAMQEMDVFIAPSLQAVGTQMSVLEAMTAGTPVVASRVEGIEERFNTTRPGCSILPATPRRSLGRSRG